jgi:soluble lytic murein transglycosylase-like protein
MGVMTRVVGLAAATGLASVGVPVHAAQAFDACFDQHAQRFGLDADLLRSIAVVESGMRPHADNNSALARTGTRDIGLMQINTSWLPVLGRYGIGLAELHDPCTSIEVGAWILSDLLRRHGNSWEALGAYNAACTQLKGRACQQARTTYAWRVWHARRQEQGRMPAETLRAGVDFAAAGGAPVRPSGRVAASSLGVGNAALPLEAMP